MKAVPEIFAQLLGFLPQEVVLVAWYVICALALLVPTIIYMAFLTLAERRVLGYMHARIGANRVGPQGLLQPFADLIKLMGKEIVIPSSSSKALFLLAPLLSLVPALAAWAVMPLWPSFAISNINAGVLYLLALSSAGVYGVILAGWATNSKYAFLGAMRAAAQMVAYEIAMGFAVVGVIMASGSLNLGDIIVRQQQHGWFILWLLPLAVVYFVSGLAETNRTPFDVVEGESEIVAGPHVEYSGMAFALFYVAEYINMILISAMTAVFFFGGWLSPVHVLPAGAAAALTSIPYLGAFFADGIHWLVFKFSLLLFCFLWFRATYPRYRYDQIMRLGWKIFIPVTLVWIAVESVLMIYKIGPWAGG